MKQILIIFLMILAVQGYSQNYSPFTSVLDTLAANGADTLATGVIERPGGVFFAVNGLKISGAPGGTISYQVSANGGSNYTTVATDTITNGTTNANYQLDKFIGNRARCIVTANATTQSGSYVISIGYKRND
jgi:hypothetical protein